MSVDQETYDRLYQRGELDPNAAYYIIDSQWFSHPTKPSKIEVKITYFID